MRLRLVTVGGISLGELQNPAALRAIHRNPRLVERASECQPVQEAGIELRDTGACRRFSVIIVKEFAHRIDEQLPFGRNQFSESRYLVFGYRLGTLIGGGHRELDE